MQIGRVNWFVFSILLLSSVALAPTSAGAEQQKPFQIAQSADQTEITFWQSVEKSGDLEMYKAYLNTYPTGVFAPLAKLKLSKLQQVNKQEAMGAVEECDQLAAHKYDINKNGKGVSWKDVEAKLDKARAVCELAAKSDVPRMKAILARTIGSGKNADEKRAQRLLSEAVAAGDPFSTGYLGYSILSGWFGFKKDHDKAIPILVKGAKLGDLVSMSSLVEVYFEGKLGRSRNLELSLRYARDCLKVQHIKHPYCHLVMGKHFETGAAVSKDYKKAMHHYERSVEIGDRNDARYRYILVSSGVHDRFESSNAENEAHFAKIIAYASRLKRDGYKKIIRVLPHIFLNNLALYENHYFLTTDSEKNIFEINATDFNKLIAQRRLLARELEQAVVGYLASVSIPSEEKSLIKNELNAFLSKNRIYLRKIKSDYKKSETSRFVRERRENAHWNKLVAPAEKKRRDCIDKKKRKLLTSDWRNVPKKDIAECEQDLVLARRDCIEWGDFIRNGNKLKATVRNTCGVPHAIKFVIKIKGKSKWLDHRGPYKIAANGRKTVSWNIRNYKKDRFTGYIFACNPSSDFEWSQSSERFYCNTINLADVPRLTKISELIRKIQLKHSP